MVLFDSHENELQTEQTSTNGNCRVEVQRGPKHETNYNNEMTSAADLKTGIDLVTRATAHDGKGELKEAILLYELSLQYFQKALQCTFFFCSILSLHAAETNEQTKALTQKKMKEYSSRYLAVCKQ